MSIGTFRLEAPTSYKRNTQSSEAAMESMVVIDLELATGAKASKYSKPLAGGTS